MKYLRLKSVLDYLEANAGSRCVTEGEAILIANHIIACGTVEHQDDSMKLLALCLKTSALTENPHEVMAKFNMAEAPKIEFASCTCKAGQSERCKHVAALLLLCSRMDMETFEKFSSTDLKCYWKNKKNVALAQYEAAPINEMDCVPISPYIQTPLNDEEAEFVIKFCAEELPDAPVIKHLRQCPKPVLDSIEEGNVKNSALQLQPNYLEIIVENCKNSQLVNNLNSIVPTKGCCQEMLATLSNVDISAVATATQQDDRIWKAQRQFRITGSRCYSIFTYKLDNWKTKCLKYFWPKSFTNKYTEHGVATECEARNAYAYANNYKVINTGLIVCQQQPWLAYTPDGVVFKKGVPVKLLEIKCPYAGRSCTAVELIHHCKYLKLENERLVLRKKHLYYGQIQLGMAILNLKECDFVVYSSFGKNFLNIVVNRDDVFMANMLEILQCNYFNNMLHNICTNKP